MMTEQHQNKEKMTNIYGPCALIFCSTETGTWRIHRPQIEYEGCVCCGICAKYCPTGVVTVLKDPSGKKKNAPGGSVQIDMTYCKGCGICANVCPKDSIVMIDERQA
jgi:2-oxoacid:acceptor oxidoreductase delta subunit (pyruvate/2-ketoisovalerate family)